MEDTYLKNLNEVYLGKGPIVPMQQQFSILRSKIKNNKVTSTTNLDPEILKFNRIVEKTFGFYKFSLYIQPNELPNVYTFTADYFFTDEQKAKIKKELIASPTGFSYEKVFPGVSIVVAINSCVIYDDQYTDEEIIGALLHEIGHGFFEVIMDEDNVYIPSTNSLRIINTILSLMKDKIKKRSNVSAESISKELNKFGKLFSSVKGIFKKKLKSMFFREALGDNMTKRMIPYTNEKFADTFAAMYGYSNEVHQFLDKVRKYVYDLAYGVRKYPKIIEIMKAYKMYLGDFMMYILGSQDEHPEGLTRIKTSIDYLKRELQRDTIDPAMKREILEQINFLNHLIEEFMNFPKDEDSMRIIRLYSIMLYKKFGGDRREKDADNDAIFDQIDKRYNMTIGSGISESARSEEKAKEKKDLSDLEFAYDKKYNAFCLTVSSYSAEKLKNTLEKKQSELDAAKKEKKDAKTRYDRLSAQIKIDYLENVCKKCNAMIKKKESYNNNESK